MPQPLHGVSEQSLRLAWDFSHLAEFEPIDGVERNINTCYSFVALAIHH
jgi:hypothetical protein